MYFFPTPYSDEILYSVLARYCIQSGNLSSIKNFEDIYGSRNIVASVELPGKMDMITSNLPANSKFTSEYFIYNNTLFPYIASFLPEKRAKEIIELMKAGNAALIYSKSGYISANIRQNRNFKFCPKCVREDIQNNGEAFWHRIHQVTEIYICTKHLVPLCESNVPLRSNNRQKFIPATPEVCCTEGMFLYSNDIFEKLLWIAEDIQKILNSPFKFQSIENHKKLFMEKLINRNFATLSGFVYQKKLRKALLEFWGIEFLQLMQCPIYDDKNCLWLSNLVRNNGIPAQPIRNLLLIRFLEIDIYKLINCYIDESNSINNKSDWEDKLIGLANKKTSLRQMAKELNSTPRTIKKHIAKLNIEPYWEDRGGRRYNSTYEDTKEFQDRKVKARKDWIQLRNKNFGLSRNKIKELDETLYTWLMRYDMKWLNTNSPKIRNYKYINWEETDKKLLQEVKKIIESIPNGKPIRITWTIIGGKLGNCGFLIKNKDKLPLTKEYIEPKIETLQEFQFRKIVWAINELVRENKVITKWNLIEMSGVKIKYIKNMYEGVKQLLCSKGYDENLLS